MDAQTEQQFLRHLHAASEGQTLVVVTHRPSLLTLVDRIIVIDNGRVAMDGPKENVLAKLRGEAPVSASSTNKVSTVTPAANSAAVAQPETEESA